MNGHGTPDRNQAAATAYERLRVGGLGGGLAVLTGLGLAGWLRRCQDAFEAPSSDPAPRRGNGRAYLAVVSQTKSLFSAVVFPV